MTPPFPPPFCSLLFFPPFFLVPLSLCRSGHTSLPLLFRVFHASYVFFLLPPQFLPPPFCRTLYCVHAPPSLPSFTEAKTLFPSVSVKNEKFAPILSHVWNVTPMIFSALSISLHKLPVCLPFWASLYPPPLPPLTSPPSLQLNLSLPELTLSLAFALTGQSPRAEHPRLYLIRHLPLPLPVSLSPSLQLFTHSSLSSPQGK